ELHRNGGGGVWQGLRDRLMLPATRTMPRNYPMTVRMIGDVALSRVEENAGPSFTPNSLYADWTPEALEKHREWMVPHCFHERTGRFLMSLHSWTIRTDRHTILVDTCVGNHK